MSPLAMSTDTDVELHRLPSSHLANDVVAALSWSKLQVVVKDRATKQPMEILSDSTGVVKAGEMLAIMGPSGSGKTTLLNTLAHRKPAAGASASGDILINGQPVNKTTMRNLSAYVEQEDALIGSLTVRETLIFAARLALPRYVGHLQGTDGHPILRISGSCKRKCIDQKPLCVTVTFRGKMHCSESTTSSSASASSPERTPLSEHLSKRDSAADRNGGLVLQAVW